MPPVAKDAPDRVRILQRKLYRAATQARSRRSHALMDKVHHRHVLGRAFEEVARCRRTRVFLALLNRDTVPRTR